MIKSRNRFFMVIIVCALAIVGYYLFTNEESATLETKQSAAEGGPVEAGGEVQGNVVSGNTLEPDTENNEPQTQTPTPSEAPASGKADAQGNGTDNAVPKGETDVEGSQKSNPEADKPKTEDGMAVIAQPESITALVNKQNKLPENYNPSDLVYPDVRFIFSEKVDKRKMRKEAAAALEKLFKAAEEDDILLAGVSAYRSHSTQTALFERYVKRDGLEKAKTYSAYPGTSEHETGLAIDVSGSDGKCAAADCFADTKESAWLEEHAHEHGFIIRYLEGKEDITGYQYEPWHLRYVGEELAAELHASGDTLEEYFNAVPVSE